MEPEIEDYELWTMLEETDGPAPDEAEEDTEAR